MDWPTRTLPLLLALLAPAVMSAQTSVPRPAAAETTARKAEPPDLSEHAVVLMFDDGWQSVFTDAYPLLRAHGMVASLPLIAGAVAGGKIRYAAKQGGYMNRAEIQELIDSLDAEIVSHSQTHPFLTKLTDDSIRRELTASRTALSGMFRRDVRFFVYPYGDVDDRVRQLVARSGYELARGIHPGPLDFAARPYNLPSTEVRQTTSLAYIKQEVTRRPQLILFFHRILASPATYTEWSTREFAELLDWLDANRVQVVTLGDLYDAYLRKAPLARRSSWKYRVEWDLLQEVNVDVTWAAERR